MIEDIKTFGIFKALKFAWQRMFRGYSDDFYWSMADYLNHYFIPAIKEFCIYRLKECTFDLVDYKGKWDIIQDKALEDDDDIIVGEITKEEAIKQAKERVRACLYYGISAYFGNNKELNKIYDKELKKIYE